MVIQEIKPDIIYRRRNQHPSAQQVANPQRLELHLDLVIRHMISYLQYIGLLRYNQIITEMQKIKKSTSVMKIKNSNERYHQCHEEACPMQILHIPLT